MRQIFVETSYNAKGDFRREPLMRSETMTTHDEADQLRHDLATQASAAEGIRQGLADLAAGRTRSAREVFDALRVDHCISR
jgi:uncharacterized membrane protein